MCCFSTSDWSVWFSWLFCLLGAENPKLACINTILFTMEVMWTWDFFFGWRIPLWRFYSVCMEGGADQMINYIRVRQYLSFKSFHILLINLHCYPYTIVFVIIRLTYIVCRKVRELYLCFIITILCINTLSFEETRCITLVATTSH